MDQQEMIAVVERHLKAEGAGDIEGAVAPYTEDIIHDAVGFPGSPPWVTVFAGKCDWNPIVKGG
jgi:hypothetical protein